MNSIPFLTSLPVLALSLLAVLSPPAAAGAREDTALTMSAESSATADTTDRLIVKLRDPVARDPGRRITEIAGRTGEALQRLRGMSGGAHVVQLSRQMSRAEASAVARSLASDPNVAYVEPDLRMHPLRVPNDTLYAQQWDLFETAGGINMPAAWDITVGSSNITVAVIDTGVRNHADLAGRLVAGHDFITDTATSNDGDGRDTDASDPGDYGCNGSTSSWHGTHVAGTIGAASNNGAGVAGVNWASKIQPVRVLGKCGGYTSDIVDAMRWAAGITVAGAPVNATPARVLNLSLGGGGACGATFQNAVNDVTARGTVVVVAAGNSNADAVNTAPASCAGVVAVAATVRNGGRASYSNFGSKVAIAAPGGGSGSAILSTLNAGSTVPAADSYALYQGTSMASPHVAGVVSLMLSVNPALTPAQVLAKLQATARAFPTGTGSDCSKVLCGAGIVDAAAAVASAAPVTHPPQPPPPPPTAGRVNLALPASGAVLTASSAYSAAFPPTAANNGDRRGANPGAGGVWQDATSAVWPDWLQADFGSLRTVAEIDVFTAQDASANPLEPTETLTFSQYGITDFEVQYWTGSAWQTVPGGSVTGNNKVWRKFTFTPVSTRQVRVLVLNALGGYSRITELEAYSVADTPASTPINVALQANGGSAVASSTYYSAYAAAAVNNGDRRGLSSGSLRGWWNDGTAGVWPDVMQINFSGTKSITEIDVFTLQDTAAAPLEPTESMIFSQYGITDFDVQYSNGSAWVTVPGGSVTANDKVWRKFTFSAVPTNSIRIVVRGARAGYSRITEIEAYGTTP